MFDMFTDDRLVLHVTKDKYLSKLVEYSNMKVHAIASVDETSQIWVDEDDFQVKKPSIDIKVSKPIESLLEIKFLITILF